MYYHSKNSWQDCHVISKSTGAVLHRSTIHIYVKFLPIERSQIKKWTSFVITILLLIILFILNLIQQAWVEHKLQDKNTWWDVSWLGKPMMKSFTLLLVTSLSHNYHTTCKIKENEQNKQTSADYKT